MESVTSYWYFKLFFPPSSLENCYEKPAGKKVTGFVPATFWVRGQRSNRFAILAVHNFIGDIFLYLNSINFLPANISANLIPLRVPR